MVKSNSGENCYHFTTEICSLYQIIKLFWPKLGQNTSYLPINDGKLILKGYTIHWKILIINIYIYIYKNYHITVLLKIVDDRSVQK